MSFDQKVIKVGSRKSQLAVVQTQKIIETLSSKYPHIKFEMVTITTTGDKILDKPLSKIGEKSVFTKELEVALLDLRVDLVVHSLKDVPTELAPNLVIGAIFKRNESTDSLVVKKGSSATSLSTLPPGSVVGTSSMRRTAQVRKQHPHLKVFDLRGNLNTRLNKLDDEEEAYDALLLATAGLVRLRWEHRITQTLPSDDTMYAVGQGALCVECRSDDADMLQFLSAINHHSTVLACIAERSFLKKLEGGCSVPVAVNCKLNEDQTQLTLKGGVYSADGLQNVEDTLQCSLQQGGDEEEEEIRPIASLLMKGVSWKQQQAAEQLGIKLAEALKERGALMLLLEAKDVAEEKLALRREAKLKKDLEAASQPTQANQPSQANQAA